MCGALPPYYHIAVFRHRENYYENWGMSIYLLETAVHRRYQSTD